jgi:hypothetical protein
MPAWAGRTYFPLGVARNASDDNSRASSPSTGERNRKHYCAYAYTPSGCHLIEEWPTATISLDERSHSKNSF